MKPNIILAILLVASTSGCATITRGTSEAWTVTSEPSGAMASLSNGERCETPCTLKLMRRFDFAIEICKPGYAVVNTSVVSSIAGAGAAGMAGNVILGGLIGVGVDASSGATKDLLPNPVAVTLVPEQPGCLSPSFPDVPPGGESPEKHAERASKR